MDANVTPKEAVFNLNKFTIPQLSFKEADARFSQLSVTFNPSGIYNPDTGIFKLTFLFKIIAVDAATNDTEEIINGKSEADFLFEPKISFEDIPSFFYTNCIAIVFPYIRAFISTISLQSGLRLIYLPILNLVSLREVLIKNTTSLNT